MSTLRNLAAVLAEPGECWVSELYLDSRQVTPQSAFVVLKPQRAEALMHVNDALSRGAIALLVESLELAWLTLVPKHIVVFAISDLSQRLGQLADAFYESPSTQLSVTGITGTNGKTTSMWLHAQVTQGLYIGTVGVGLIGHVTPSTHTTADVLTLNRVLHDCVSKGIKQVSLEVSSHALDQGRTQQIRMPVVGFSNITRDHLDYHPSFEHYLATKERILQGLGVQTAVLNGDDPWVRQVGNRLPAGVKALWVGQDVYHGARFVRLDSVVARDNGLVLKGETHAGSFNFTSPLIGKFNADNLVMVIGMCLAQDYPLNDIIAALSIASAPPGRMEVFKGRGATVVVDYAHTPDALEKALAAVAAHARGHIYCVMGCGGDRDNGKRPLMGQVAEQQADQVVLTDDNPRHEDPAAIIREIQSGMTGMKPVTVQRNRAAAIEWAYRQATPTDWVLVAGKGHEEYQIVGDQKLPYSDRELALKLVKEAA
jgi:UDP-N-acetylmuramoyl-L-alanyl-D-glutamate--2,6-diaminopimelate ligase